MDAPFPMHPSYEDREDAPDRAFSKVSPQQGGQMVAAWARLIAGSARLRRAEIFHLHHLTPLHEAVATAMGGVPIVTHLHGTELKMLDAIAREQPGVGQGPYARWWAEHMGEAARRADATIAISPISAARPCGCSGSTRPRCTSSPTASMPSASRSGGRATTSGASAGSTGSCATRRAGTRRASYRGAFATRRTKSWRRSSTRRPAHHARS